MLQVLSLETVWYGKNRCYYLSFVSKEHEVQRSGLKQESCGSQQSGEVATGVSRLCLLTNSPSPSLAANSPLREQLQWLSHCPDSVLRFILL